ncbi:MAG TPA: DNA mismatch repair protein MutS [Aminobacterium sp.]|nr:DNA mismatch repair protein MutS [Aminobacterium sp.]
MKLPPNVKMTPMLSQYVKWKGKYPDCLLFFRMGDFYEMFFDDAHIASEVLDITLTSRDPEKSIPMAGVPYHAVHNYLGRLIKAGYKVAICEQMSEPDGKTLVEREVIRIVTPGTYVPEDAGEEGRLAALSIINDDRVALAMLLVDTGRLEMGTLATEEALSVLTAFNPGEVLIEDTTQKDALPPELQEFFLLKRSREHFVPESSTRWLCQMLNVPSLSAFGVDDGSSECGCAAAVLRYLEETQFGAIHHITRLFPLREQAYLYLDTTSQRNLELVDSDGPTLYSVLNKCKNPMGRRLLRQWILRPLLDVAEIHKRQEGVEELLQNATLRINLQKTLSLCRDIERASSRLSLGTGGPRDLGAIRDTLQLLPEILELCMSGFLSSYVEKNEQLLTLRTLLSSSLNDELPRSLQSGGVIRYGYNEELDSWRDLKDHADEWLGKYVEREREKTGIPKLKVGSNKVFGYYLEVTRSNADKVPENYIRKQTLVSAERFITTELKEFEEKMVVSEQKIVDIEGVLYKELVKKTLTHIMEIQDAAAMIAQLDVLASLAQVAWERNYIRPDLDESLEIHIAGGRHPVIEATFLDQPFVPNDVDLDGEGIRIALITGPNMAGKSTYLRMAALLVIMAQMGSFIPASSAKVGVVDRVFTRIGARDELARGNSTFMVEMIETANILHNVTDRSLVVLDEVGRGTSTYDGMSIAWAVLEYLHNDCNARPKVFFATHYHELVDLEKKLSGLKNYSMAVHEGGEGITFLHKIVEGPADRSYGIEVARLAGIPSTVLKRAFHLLETFEKTEEMKPLPLVNEPSHQISLFPVTSQAIIRELATINPDKTTPFRALELLYKITDRCREELRKNGDL